MLNQSFSLKSVAEHLENEYVLAVIPLVSQCEPFVPGVIPSGTPAAHKGIVNEIWMASSPVKRGKTGASFWSENEDVICIAQWLSKDDCNHIEQSTERAYLFMLSLLQEKGFPHPFRFWNYLPGINYGNGDEEVYKKFCTGRLNAFTQSDIPPSAFPAASALGHHGEGAAFYVFASKIKPQHFTNSQQVNAYEYPREYGISSPSFARATAIKFGPTPFLFISGTASIIGHKSVEIGNLERQLEVTMANIALLLENANPDQTRLAAFKVYIRHEEHVDFTRTWLSARYPEVDAAFIIADICRQELLVEIECFCA